MTPTDTPAKNPQGVSPGLALILSAVILPGLGQLLTGHKIRGAIMAVSTALWLLGALLKLFKDLASVTPQLSQIAISGEQLRFSDIQAAMHPLAGGLVWVFLPLAIIWFWALSDSVFYIIQNKRLNR